MDILYVFNNITLTILDFGRNLFNFMFLPLTEFLSESGEFGEYLLGLIDFAGGADLFTGFTLLSLIFSLGAVAWLVIYFFIP